MNEIRAFVGHSFTKDDAEAKRSPAVWNNLGVEFDHFSMPSKSVRAYRTAEDSGETLAMSNLAAKFIAEGFLVEAQEKCDVALKIPEYHPNVAKTLSLIRSTSEKESQTEKEVLGKVNAKIDFYTRFGKAMSKLTPKKLGTNWIAPECPLIVWE